MQLTPPLAAQPPVASVLWLLPAFLVSAHITPFHSFQPHMWSLIPGIDSLGCFSSLKIFCTFKAQHMCSSLHEAFFGYPLLERIFSLLKSPRLHFWILSYQLIYKCFLETFYGLGTVLNSYVLNHF